MRAQTLQPKAKVRGAHTFDLSGELDAFTSFVTSRVVPVYAARYSAQIEKEWSRVSQRFSDKTPATQKLYVSKFRKSLELALISQEPDADRRSAVLRKLKTIVRNDPALIDLVNQTYSAKIVENTRSLILIANYPEIVALARKWLNDEDDRHVAIGLMLLTGRRFYEVLVAGEFSPSYERLEGSNVRGTVTSKWSLEFSGQLKTREAEGTRFEQRFTIPTLAPSNEILPALDRLRTSELGQFAANSTQASANSLINPRLNRALRRSALAAIWPQADPEFSLKSVRALYAEICYKHHAHGGIHKDTYFAQILGHRDGDLRTALSYVRYYLDEKDSVSAKKELIRIASESERLAREFEAQRLTDPTIIPNASRVRSESANSRSSRGPLSAGDIAPYALRDLLRERGIEMGAFAASIGRHRTTVWRNLSGSGSEEIHRAIAQALDLPLSTLWPSRYEPQT